LSQSENCRAVTGDGRLGIAIKAGRAAIITAFFNDEKIAKRTKPLADRCIGMETHATFTELRELLKVAQQLRQAATETDDRKYTTLFLHTAASLEAHARKRAFGSHGISEPREGHYLPDSMVGLN
jgi:hypothetical protein